MAEAVITRGVGGHYTLHRHDPPFEGLAYLRGILRQDDLRPLAGDRVRFESSHDPDIPYVVEAVLPRKNVSQRPAVANLDMLVLTVSIVQPKPDLFLIDRLIVYAAENDIIPVLLVTKTDLATTKNRQVILADITANYARSGLAMFADGFDGDDSELDRFMEHIRGKTVAFAGQSGVGKSTKLNRLLGDVINETGAVSDKIGLGRHTTRETQLFPVAGGGYIADTPGFSVLNLGDLAITPEGLRRGYAEFREVEGVCRFLDCRHDGDMGCAVSDAIIHPERLDRYRKLLQETVSGMKPGER
ncbi:MAG TPA: ribosome small subunit-dependent GTPase A [Clostridiaceae bacterium]|nr:ribosome small subunit-dependent GTPase A [Clostridiaceae bacterium]